jgi:sucrose-6-phosphate hydrolase SacC (GH32 family)
MTVPRLLHLDGDRLVHLPPFSKLSSKGILHPIATVRHSSQSGCLTSANDFIWLLPALPTALCYLTGWHVDYAGCMTVPRLLHLDGDRLVQLRLPSKLSSKRHLTSHIHRSSQHLIWLLDIC